MLQSELVKINLILEMIEKIERNSGNSLDDENIFDATLMRFQVMGECIDKLPKEIKERHKEINWKKFYGFRNSISHEYASVPKTIVSNLLTELSTLKKVMTKLKAEVRK